jgi:hypothetical protein
MWTLCLLSSEEGQVLRWVSRTCVLSLISS